jgi:hypothetical protein
MSRFGDLRKGVAKTPAIETPVVDTTPSSVEEPPRPEEEVADAVSGEKKFTDMSKEELEEYGRTIGIELDRRHSKKKLIKQLEEHIDYLKTV